MRKRNYVDCGEKVTCVFKRNYFMFSSHEKQILREKKNEIRKI